MREGKDGKYFFGVVRVGEKGQIVIPKDCREVFDIHTGDSLLVLGDEKQGIAIVKAEEMMEFANMLFSEMKKTAGTGGKKGTSLQKTSETGEKNEKGARRGKSAGTGDGK